MSSSGITQQAWAWFLKNIALSSKLKRSKRFATGLEKVNYFLRHNLKFGRKIESLPGKKVGETGGIPDGFGKNAVTSYLIKLLNRS